MKILHLSDTHLIVDDKPSLYGIDPVLRLKRAFGSMQKLYSDAYFVVITGDLSDDGSVSSYIKLKEEIDNSGFEVCILVGNHDKRDNLRTLFPQFFNDGFVQYVREFNEKVFIFLDTLVENEAYGELCKSRFKWLRDNLIKYVSKDIYIFMHHHPVDSGLYEMDNFANFRTSHNFWKLLYEYKNIKHVTFGHLHRIFHGQKNGITFHSTRSSTFQVALKQKHKDELLTNNENPAYSIINIDTNLSIHHHEYMDEDIVYKGYC